MFSNKNKERAARTAAVSHNSLVRDAIVKGNVQSVIDIRVDGRIEGDLRCKAKVVLGQTSVIKGNIHCQNAIIEGKVLGNVYCQQLLDVRKSAKIQGDLETTKLAVEDGAQMNGACKMNLQHGIQSQK